MITLQRMKEQARALHLAKKEAEESAKRLQELSDEIAREFGFKNPLNKAITNPHEVRDRLVRLIVKTEIES